MVTRKWWILVVVALAFGAARMPVEQRFTRDFKEAGLFPDKLQLGTRDKIGQTSSVVALGGLRTLVATFLNLRAFGFFAEQRWDDLAQTYDTIVDLAPRTRYYWDSGAWHQAYNEASYYLNDSELPPLRRHQAWKHAIHRGRAFLERGIRNNPDDWTLRTQLGVMLLDPNKFTAFRDRGEVFGAAAEAYRIAAMDKKAPTYAKRFRVYALARIEGREPEALELARELHAAGAGHRTPTLLTLLYVMESHANPEGEPLALAVRLFGSEEKAYDTLSKYWMRSREGYPIHGMARGLKMLEQSLGIDDAKSVLLKQPLPPPNPRDWFHSR